MGIKVTGKIWATSQDMADRIAAGLPEHIRLSRAEPGNVSFNITQGDDAWTWIVDEEFTDADAFKAHGARMANSAWANAAQGIERDITVKDTA